MDFRYGVGAANSQATLGPVTPECTLMNGSLISMMALAKRPILTGAQNLTAHSGRILCVIRAEWPLEKRQGPMFEAESASAVLCK